MPILTILQIIVAFALIFLILLQAKGTGLGSAFGGGNAVYHTKKGVEKLVFSMTIASAVLLAILTLVNLKV